MKTLTAKNRAVIRLFVENPDLPQKEIAKLAGVSPTRISLLKREPLFMQELQKSLDLYWNDAGRVARKKMIELMENGDYRAVEFILRTTGLNPTEKQEIKADVNGDINININD